MSVVSAIVLAAGQARRFGSAKVLALLGGEPLVRHAARALARADVDALIVVVPRDDPAYTAALDGVHAHLRIVVHEGSTEGMSSSLQEGLRALDPKTRAILIALGDQPTIQSDVAQSLIKTWRESGNAVVAPVYRGNVRGHPVLFDAALIPELLALVGDRGAREVLERDPERVTLVHCEAYAPADVDTADDLAALTRSARLA